MSPLEAPPTSSAWSKAPFNSAEKFQHPAIGFRRHRFIKDTPTLKWHFRLLVKRAADSSLLLFSSSFFFSNDGFFTSAQLYVLDRRVDIVQTINHRDEPSRSPSQARGRRRHQD